MQRTTETASKYRHLEQMSVAELISNINKEDQTVPLAVAAALPQIERLVHAVVACMRAGGRLFYIGAGTSGRLGIVDASECPPTFGVPQGMVVGIIAGGDTAIRKAVEFAEDDTEQAFHDLSEHDINPLDIVVGIAASGSTRMKSGTAQKLVLNMITTAAMVQLGRVQDNKMVDMQLTNNKLVDRGERMIMDATGATQAEAAALLAEYGSVREAVSAWNTKA